MSVDETRALRAVAHPLRLRILSLLTGNPMSAAEVARELGLTHANASYHLRLLRDAGELVEAGEELIRGGLAKRYRYPHERGGKRPGRPTATPESQVVEVRAQARELERRVRERKPRTRNVLSDLEGWVDPDVWRRAGDLILEASRLLHDHNQPPRTPGTVHVSQTSWCFEMRTTEGGS